VDGDGEFAVYNKDHVDLDKFAVKVYESNCTDFIKIDPVFEYAYGTKIESDIYYDVVGNFNQFEMKKYESKNMYVIEEDDTENDTDTNFMEVVLMGFKVMFCILLLYCIYYCINHASKYQSIVRHRDFVVYVAQLAIAEPLLAALFGAMRVMEE
jgi:hypothetical protein